MKWLIPALCLAATALATVQAPSAPQEPAAKTGDNLGDEELRTLLESAMTARLSEGLGLNEEQTVLMVRRLSEARQITRELRKQRQAIVKDLKAGLQSAMADAQIEEKLEQIIELDAKLAEARKTAYDKACEGLSPTQRAKLYIHLGEFEAEMRQLIQKAKERRAERGGPLLGGKPGEGRRAGKLLPALKQRLESRGEPK